MTTTSRPSARIERNAPGRGQRSTASANKSLRPPASASSGVTRAALLPGRRRAGGVLRGFRILLRPALDRRRQGLRLEGRHVAAGLEPLELGERVPDASVLEVG